ncbi:hypothetical protein BASA81_012835 [Batrachochytrium salamandrivorans]|nr:hypothetical protein BASA81_012835 [Batrachochytrium salamandrivorans]
MERCCWQFWCCCCEDKCTSLTDERRAPLLKDVDETRDGEVEAVMLGSQVYFRSVSKAFKSHFTDDPEVYQAWQSLSWADIALATFKMTQYREKRIASGGVELPPAVQLGNHQSPLVCSEILSWAFFADAAYVETEQGLREKLLERNHQLISLEKRTSLMEPAHFLSMSNTEKLVVIGIKGTSSANDWLTNLFIAKEELRVGEEEEGGGRDFGIHAGVLHGARFVKERVGSILQRAFYDAGFSIVVVGHSLGAGVAGALAMLLKEEYLLERVTCFAFAPPPAFSLFLSLRSREYIYSIVNNDDAIPRTGVAQLKSLALGIRNIVHLKQIQGGSWDTVARELDELTWGDIMQKFARGKAEEQFDTYIPGRILFLYEHEGGGAREIYCDAPTLRIAVVSATMVSDHGMDSYCRRLEQFGVLVV